MAPLGEAVALGLIVNELVTGPAKCHGELEVQKRARPELYDPTPR